MHRYAVARVTAHEDRIAGLKRLLDDEARPKERATLQAMIEREDIAAELAGSMANVLFMICRSPGLKADIRAMAAAQSGAGDDDVDLTRYDE